MAFEIVPVPKLRMMSSAASAPWPEAIMSCHFRPCGIGHDVRGPADDQREEAEAVRVVGDHQEVERARELHRLPAVRGDLLAAREAEGVGAA